MIARKVTALVRSLLDLGGTDEEKEARLKEARFLLNTVVAGLYPPPPPKPEPKKKTTSKRRTR